MCARAHVLVCVQLHANPTAETTLLVDIDDEAPRTSDVITAHIAQATREGATTYDIIRAQWLLDCANLMGKVSLARPVRAFGRHTAL